MGPFASSDGHDAPRLVDELVPRLTAVVDDVVVGGEDPVGEPVIAHELPDVLDRVQLGTFGRQSDDRSEEHTSELQSLMRISYAVFCLKKKKKQTNRSQKHITLIYTTQTYNLCLYTS